LAITATKDQQDAPDQRHPAPGPPPRAGKLPILLLTPDDSLWPQIGRGLRGDLQLKHVDTIDELLATIPAGQSAILLWDARGEDAPAGSLSRLQLHSAQFATVALGDAEPAATWQSMVARGQLVAFLPAPFEPARLREAIDAAVTEVQARCALLGATTPTAAVAMAESEPAKSRTPLFAVAVGLSLLAAAGAAYLEFNHAIVDKPAGTDQRAPTVSGDENSLPGRSAGTDEKVFQLLDGAQQAMRERRYIEPAAGSAIALYHEVLIYDPNNEEAHQGMQRLAEILFSRVQSALDERKFDTALQSLETARSIDPADRRIAAIDARIATMRSDIGSAQIQAAISAEAFDRAEQLLEDAARNKSLSDVKIAQLHDEVSHRRADAEVDGLLKLVDARLQQDRLVDPHNDNATYYLDQARRAGASAAVLQARSQELARRMRAHESPPPVNVAAHAKGEEPSLLDLVEARLNGGQILEPEHDNALYYLNELSAAEPKNPGLAQLAGAVQAQILARATAAAAGGQTDEAKRLVQAAASLGLTPEIAALNERLSTPARPKDAAPPAPPHVSANLLKEIVRLNPEYPASALAAETEGWVELAFTVLADGKVADVSVVDSMPHNIFERAARNALLRTRYQPFTQDGRPIAVTANIRVSFHLANHRRPQSP